jgi:hypothetical protein
VKPVGLLQEITEGVDPAVVSDPHDIHYLTLAGAKLKGGGRVCRVTGDDPMAYNEPGVEAKVTIREEAVNKVGKSLTLSVSRCPLLRTAGSARSFRKKT